jgi:hypothetical protein
MPLVGIFQPVLPQTWAVFGMAKLCFAFKPALIAVYDMAFSGTNNS